MNRVTRCIVQFSGGAGSYMAARRCVERFGKENVTLVFADTKMEDADLYRFLHEAAESIDAPLEIIADGRNPWQVFRDERYLGNSRVDPCSKILKRQLLDRWRTERFDPADTCVALGYDWTEEHRYVKAKPRFAPWTLIAPMCDRPLMLKAQVLDAMEDAGIRRPRLYTEGFQHNNCGGFCVKAGQAQFAHLHRTKPELYAYHEAEEEALRVFLGKDVAIMKDRRGGGNRPMTMREFRERIDEGGEFDRLDWGGCGCFSGDDSAIAKASPHSEGGEGK